MKIKEAKFDMDSNYVYAALESGDIILVDCDAFEQAYAENMYQRSELDYLIYNDPASYVQMAMDGDAREYLQRVTQYTRLNDLR